MSERTTLNPRLVLYVLLLCALAPFRAEASLKSACFSVLRWVGVESAGEKAQRLQHEARLLSVLTQSGVPEAELKERLTRADAALRNFEANIPQGLTAEEQVKYELQRKQLEKRVFEARLPLLWRERGFKDVRKTRYKARQIEWMMDGKAPLGFKSPEQWNQMKDELVEALKKDGLSEARVFLRGTATTFYSSNPDKGARHFFDQGPGFLANANPEMTTQDRISDIDFVIQSKALDGQLAAQAEPRAFYMLYQYPQLRSLNAFARRWGVQLGRKINLVGIPSIVSYADGKSPYNMSTPDRIESQP